jgi:hypothetical protein
MEVGGNNCGKLLVNVSVHLKVLRVFGVGGIDVETSSIPELPVILDSLNPCVSGGGVGENAGDLVLLSVLPEVALDREVFMVCCQTCQTVEHWVSLASLLLH